MAPWFDRLADLWRRRFRRRLARGAPRGASLEGLAVTGHELRTPLLGIVGTVSLLERTALDAEQRDLVRALHDSSEQLLAVVNGLLNSVAPGDGRGATHRAFRLGDEVEKVLAAMRSEARERGVDLRSEGRSGPALLGDPTAVRCILFNLVGNALRHTERGHVLVRFSVALPADGTACVDVAVEDTGEGIPEEVRDRVFERGVRGGGAARRGPSSGLGLYIVRRIVERLGGDIGFETEVGRGTTFHVRFELPVAGGAVPEETPSTVAPVGRCDGRPLSVLLAEDHPTNRRIARRMLEVLGCEVVAAAHGAEALEAAARRRFDIFFLDGEMPGLDGFETARRLRSFDATRSMPLVAMTAHAGEDGRARCREAGFDHVLVKPFTLSELEILVRRIVADRDPTSDTLLQARSGPDAEVPLEVGGSTRLPPHL